MLEFYLESGYWLRQLRECAIGDYVDAFADWLESAGFTAHLDGRPRFCAGFRTLSQRPREPDDP